MPIDMRSVIPPLLYNLALTSSLLYVARQGVGGCYWQQNDNNLLDPMCNEILSLTLVIDVRIYQSSVLGFPAKFFGLSSGKMEAG